MKSSIQETKNTSKTRDIHVRDEDFDNISIHDFVLVSIPIVFVLSIGGGHFLSASIYQSVAIAALICMIPVFEAIFRRPLKFKSKKRKKIQYKNSLKSRDRLNS